VVPFLDLGDIAAHLPHDPSALMAEYRRKRDWKELLLHDDVGVAHSYGSHLNDHFMGPRIP